MVGKRVQFDDETWSAINLLRRERKRSFQQLADEAFADLLDKHGRPPDLKAQLRSSVDAARGTNGDTDHPAGANKTKSAKARSGKGRT